MAVALVTLGLGSGMTTIGFSVFNAVVLQSVPGLHPERIVSVSYVSPSASRVRIALSNGAVGDLRQRVHVFEEVAWFRRVNALLLGTTSGGRTLQTVLVSNNFLNVFQVQPQLGGGFPTHGRRAESDSILLSDALWRNDFGGKTTVLGSTVRLSGVPYVVVGVMPPGFGVPSTGVDIWVGETVGRPSSAQDYSVIGRLRGGLDVGAAQRLLLATPPVEATEAGRDLTYSALLLRDQLVGHVAWTLRLILGALALVLLVACANVAALLLVRTAGRRREYATQVALGATPAVVARTCVTEPVLIALGGGGLAVGLTAVAAHLIRALGVSGVPRLETVGIDAYVLWFTLAVTTLTAVAVGAVPVIRARTLAGSSLTAQHGMTTSRSQRSLHGLIVVQIGGVVILMVVAALLLVSVAKLAGVAVGFEPRGLSGILTRRPFEPDLTATRDVIASVEALPDVESVAVGTMLPIGKLRPFRTNVAAEQADGHWVPLRGVEYQAVSEAYFRTMGIRLLRGREFRKDDAWGAPCVVIANELLATTMWPQIDPLGRQIDLGVTATGERSGRAMLCEVIGLVGNTRSDLEAPPDPQLFFAVGQRPEAMQALVIRTIPGGRAHMDLILGRLKALDAGREVIWSGPLEALVTESVLEPRFFALLSSVLAAFVLTLAASGMYGVTAYAVTLRRREIGIRLALGTDAQGVRWLIVGSAARACVIGVSLGLVGAVLTTRVIEHRLFGIDRLEHLTFAMAALVVAAVVLAASYLAALQAGRIDPRSLLNTE